VEAEPLQEPGQVLPQQHPVLGQDYPDHRCSLLVLFAHGTSTRRTVGPPGGLEQHPAAGHGHPACQTGQAAAPAGIRAAPAVAAGVKPGSAVTVYLPDGKPYRAAVTAIYARSLALGSLLIPASVAAGHTGSTPGYSQILASLAVPRRAGASLNDG
jgi:hypothetical protein